MNDEMKVINALIKLEEQSNLLRHGEEVICDGLNLAEVHCIDWIGRVERANVTKVANDMNMTKGAICKINKKLLSKGLIESYQLPENNKEIYYRLTDCGQKVYEEHKKCHEKAKTEKMALLKNYTADEQAVILRFLNDINLMRERNLRGKY
jgi:Transcriptional regulators